MLRTRMHAWLLAATPVGKGFDALGNYFRETALWRTTNRSVAAPRVIAGERWLRRLAAVGDRVVVVKGATPPWSDEPMPRGGLTWTIEGDEPVVMGSVLVTTAFFVLSTLVCDIINAALDPRLRGSERSAS